MKTSPLIILFLALYYFTDAQIRDPRELVPLSYDATYTCKNDTIFGLKIYPSKSIPDSIVIYSFSSKLLRRKWITFYEGGDFRITKFSKMKKTSFFEKHLEQDYDYECKPRSYDEYHNDGSVFSYRSFGIWTYSKMRQL